MNFVIFTNVEMDERELWTNRQFISLGIAKKHRVLYFAKGIGVARFIKDFIRRRRKFTELWRWTRGINGNLKIFLPVVPWDSKLRFMRKINHEIILIALKGIMKRLRFKMPVLYFYELEYVDFIKRLKNGLVCYDCVDEISGFTNYLTQKQISDYKSIETELLKKSDVVFTTSMNLYNEKSKRNENTHFVHNVGDYDHFNKTMMSNIKIAKDIECLQKPVIGFIGNISTRAIDIELLESTAKSMPVWTIVMIGPISVKKGKEHVFNGLKLMSNVHFLGWRSYDSLPNYIKGFDVCIIPYKVTEGMHFVFPIKFFEFLASGKPIVSTELFSLKEYAYLEGFWIAKDNNEFIRCIETALSSGIKGIEKRIELARKNTWESRVNRILEIIETHLNKINEK